MKKKKIRHKISLLKKRILKLKMEKEINVENAYVYANFTFNINFINY